MSVWTEIEINPGVSVCKLLFDDSQRDFDNSSNPENKPRDFEINFWRCNYKKIKEWHCFEFPLSQIEKILKDIDFWIKDKKSISPVVTQFKIKVEGSNLRMAFYNNDSKIHYYNPKPRESNYYNPENNQHSIKLFKQELINLKEELVKLTSQKVMAS